MRRQKRLRKLITNESATSDRTSSFSPSSLYSHSTVEILKHPLSEITFDDLEGSSLSSYFTSSGANIYHTPSSMLKNQQSTPSKIDPWEHFAIREAVENEVRHLILEFHSKVSSSETLESVKSKKENLKSLDFSEQVKDVSHHDSRPSHRESREIETVVKAELKKYNIGQVV